ncbi:MAG: Gfo/Idh/MocA family oxidoreductase [Bacteroidia bacterium]|nr:Gfo/Idh/MocA family oxidoreductase [Bacteroidia bacterium]
MNRRSFLKTTAAAGVTYSALPLFSALKRTTKYRIALIGSGWWGMNILREAIAFGDCKVVGVCDVDRRHLDAAVAEINTLNGDRPKAYGDYRELLQKEKPEIVIVGTPDHWHALCAIAAIESGAHVYVEKPIGHTINEGKAMVAAARNYNRVVQVGTHRRVSPHNISAREFIQQGKVGKISQVKCFVNYGQNAGTKTPDAEPPKELDWDMWCGPAPLRPYNPGIHPKGFRNYTEYANGMIGDWGIHWFDQVLWCLEEKYPKTVFSTGGVFVREDGSNAPDTQMAIFGFEDFTMTWEHKRCAPNANEDHNVGCYFYGTEGTFHLGWLDGWTFYPADKKKEKIKFAATLHQPDAQNIKELWADFMDAIENERRPLCDIEIGHRSTNISLLGMISYNLGRSVAWDGEKETIIGDDEANKLLSRDYRGDWKYPGM